MGDKKFLYRELIYKYINNEASEIELTSLEQYFKTKQGIAHLNEIMIEFEFDFDASHLKGMPQQVRSKEVDSNPIVSWKEIAIIAANIAFVMIVISYILIPRSSEITRKTNNGERLTITLPDNTLVTLNENSKLSYPRNWEHEKFRNVTLIGEAFFKVQRNEKKAFIVHTSKLDVRVLGTSFNVKAYNEDELIETTLVEGKVRIEKKQGDNTLTLAELKPNHMAVFRKQSGQIKIEDVKSENLTSWRQGILVIEQEDFAAIIKHLERLYGVKFIVKNATALACRFNTKIEGESIDDVLKLFMSSGHATYSIKNNLITIEGVPCER